MWIEIFMYVFNARGIMSRPVRALWIEILKYILCYLRNFVEAREGLVD